MRSLACECLERTPRWRTRQAPCSFRELGHEGSRAGLVLYVNPELQRWRALVDGARVRLAELEAGFTIEKAQVEAMKARLFARLREHFQRRDRRRLVIGYRRKYLESLVRQGGEDRAGIPAGGRAAGAGICRDGGGAGGKAGTHRRGSRRGEPALAEAGEAVSPRPLRARAGL